MPHTDYIYFSARKSTASRIWEGEVKRYLEEKPVLCKLLYASIGVDVSSAFDVGDQSFRLVFSRRQYQWAENQETLGIQALYDDLVYVADHIDSIKPDDSNNLTAGDQPLPTLRHLNYWACMYALDRLADSREYRACRWVFHFGDKDHFLCLPSTPMIRAHRDSHRVRGPEGSIGGPTLPVDGNDADDQRDVDRLNEGNGDRLTNGPQEEQKATTFKMTFEILEIVGPDEFLSRENRLVRLKPEDLHGRKVGDQLIAYMTTKPHELIDLTRDDVQTKWQSQLDLRPPSATDPSNGS